MREWNVPVPVDCTALEPSTLRNLSAKNIPL